MKLFGWLILGSVFAIVGCSGPAAGPEKIYLDREVCERCRMIISEPNFASEIRGGPENSIYKFGDFGDAIWWLREQNWAEKPTEFWVMDMDDGETWLDAKTVWYIGDQSTPMDFGYGAVAKQRDGAIDFEMARTMILQQDRTMSDHGGH